MFETRNKLLNSKNSYCNLIFFLSFKQKPRYIKNKPPIIVLSEIVLLLSIITQKHTFSVPY